MEHSVRENGPFLHPQEEKAAPAALMARRNGLFYLREFQIGRCYRITGTPLPCRYSFTCRMLNVRKWKTDAARRTCAPPLVTAS